MLTETRIFNIQTINCDIATTSIIVPDIIIIQFSFNKLEDMGCFFDFLDCLSRKYEIRKPNAAYSKMTELAMHHIKDTPFARE